MRCMVYAENPLRTVPDDKGFAFNSVQSNTLCAAFEGAFGFDHAIVGGIFAAVALFFFAFSSILGNYYYGEANVRYLTRRKWVLNIYRILVSGMVMFGAVAILDLAWSLADITMGLMALYNLIAISLLGKYAFRLLEDYRAQKSTGVKDPVFTKNHLKEVEKDIECW